VRRLPDISYFTQLLPSLAHIALPLSVLGVVLEPRTRPFMIAALAYVLIYSFAPMKAERYIIFSVPLINMVAAVAITKITSMGKSNYLAAILSMLLKLTVILLVLTIPIQLYIDSYKYPGGHALTRLQELNKVNNDMTFVSIDKKGINSGATGFVRTMSKWTYFVDDDEHGPDHYNLFDYMVAPDASPFTKRFEILDSIKGYEQLKWMNFNGWLNGLSSNFKSVREIFGAQKLTPSDLAKAMMLMMPFEIITSDQSYVLKKKPKQETKKE